ncbi:arylsulfatase [candidate division KSB1 bacterium]|nr:arylsulfatase [candidate division KSB1 bacterium]
MERREFIKSLGVIAPSVLMANSFANVLSCTLAQDRKKPNIVILVADDLGWGDVGYHGAEFATPHIGRIVQEGVELDRFYTCPVCSPTRAGLLTGRYPIRFGLQRRTVKPWGTRGMPPEEETLPEMLESAGYKRRAIFGKWHLGRSTIKYHPLYQGFTHFIGHYGGSIDYFSHKSMRALDWHRQLELNHDEGYSTHLIGDEAVRFIKESNDKEPFFLYVPFNAVHTPNDAPQEYLDRFSHIANKKRQQKAAMTTAMDDNIGKILQALDEEKIADNTLVLFFSDNGGATGAGSTNMPLRGEKHDLFEGGIRVPAAIRWPSTIKGGRKVDVPMSYIDVLPTLQNVVGIKPDQNRILDGENVFDYIQGTHTRRDWVFHSYFAFWLPHKYSKTDPRIFTLEINALHADDWKLVRIGPRLLEADDPIKDSELYLFRINEDPYEEKNLAAENPDIVQKMLKEVVAFRRLQPKNVEPIALDPPKGWKPPETWKIPEK